jgi:hypothetical protein
MAEINYNNLYNQLKPMEQRYYDQQFSKKYDPSKENIMLTSQPAYEQMKSVYESQQQVPEAGFFDSIFGSASAAEPPAIPNLSYRNITPTFDLATGITNTTNAAPFINTADILNKYNVPGLRNQDLVNQMIEQNRQKVVSDFINAPQDDYASLYSNQLPYSGIGSMRYKTPRTIADQNRILGQTFTPQKRGGILDLLGRYTSLGNLIRGPGKIIFDHVRAINQRIRNTDFGRSKNLAEYFDRRSRAKNAARMAEKYKEFGERDGGDRGKGMESSSAVGGVYGGGAGGLHSGE